MPMYDLANKRLVDLKLFRKKGLSLPGLMAGSYFQNYGIREFAFDVILAAYFVVGSTFALPGVAGAKAPAFRVAIRRVFGSGSWRQVIGIEARRIVARVHDDLRFRGYIAMDDFVGKTMHSPVFSGMANNTVSHALLYFVRPFKAGVRVFVGCDHFNDLRSLPRLSTVGL